MKRGTLQIDDGEKFIRWLELINVEKLCRRNSPYEVRHIEGEISILDHEHDIYLSLLSGGEVTIMGLDGIHRNLFNFCGGERYTNAVRDFSHRYNLQKEKLESAETKRLLKEFQKGLS